MDRRLVKVTWNDASDGPGDSSWFSDADVDAFADCPCEVVSVGWIRSDTKMYLTLVADYIDEKGKMTWGRLTKIPHGMIIKIEDLSSAAESQTESP